MVPLGAGEGEGCGESPRSWVGGGVGAGGEEDEGELCDRGRREGEGVWVGLSWRGCSFFGEGEGLFRTTDTE